MWSHLGKQVKDFLYATNMFLPTLEEVDLKPIEDELLIDTPAEESVEPEDLVNGSLDEDLYYEEEDNDEAISDLPETVILPLPSNIVPVKFGPSLESLRSIERELQKGQANDALEGLCIGLTNKSLLLLTDVNKRTSTKDSTQAWASVWNAQSQILLHAHAYQRLESTQMYWDSRGSSYLSETGGEGSCCSQEHHIC